MKSVRFFYFAIFSMLIFNISFVYAKNIEWQRLELEQLITDNYRDLINNLIDRKSFIIKSQVSYNNPGMPNFDDLNETDIKISDLAFDESRGDYIAFSKVGLEIPVIDKLYKEHQAKLKELYRYNESFDLFKNIESIKVSITIDKAVPQQKFSLVEGIIKKHSIDIGGFQPQVTVTHEPLSIVLDPASKEAAAADDSITLKDIINFISSFGNAIGLITAVILIGIILNKLLKMWMDFKEKLNEMENAINQEEQNDEPEEETIESEEKVIGEDNLAPSFERFLNIVKLREEQAALILKKWISEADHNAMLALTGVVQQLNNDEMQKLFKHFNAQEREKWNKLILEYLSGADLVQANKIIEQRVVKEIIGGSFIDDFELIDLILSMNNDTIKDYVLKGSKNSSTLMNLLNPDIVAQILDDLTVEQVEQVVTLSLTFNSDQFKDLEAFKEDLAAFVSEHKSAPFTQKLVDVLKDINADKEELIYNFVSKTTPRGELLKAALTHLPGQVILDLPAGFIKDSMQKYSTQDKVELLLSLDQNKAEDLMNTFTEEGSSAKEMIKMEMDNIKTDQLAMKRIEKSKNTIWSKFIVFIRQAAAENQEYKSEIEDIVTNWVDNLKSNTQQRVN